MFHHFFKIAWRNLLRHKMFSLINLLGLAIGFLCVLFIFLYVGHELSYDRYHANAAKIFRVGYEVSSANEPIKRLAWVSALTGPMLKAEYPEIVETARFRNIGAQVRYGEKRFTERKIFYADASAFKVFSFKFLQGDPETALQAPYTVVLTRPTAQKYFGVEDPLGKTLTVDDTLLYRVTGVIEPVPSNSHFSFDFLFSHATRDILSPFIKHWFALGTHTYVLTNGEITAGALESKISGAVMKHFAKDGAEMGIGIKLFVQPLTDIHLHSALQMEIEPNNNATLVYVFSVIAILILLIACCNYINLTTARFVGRAKEVGIRKVGGSSRPFIALQFFTETFLLAALAVVVAWAAAELLLPSYNTLLGKNLTLDLWRLPWLLPAMIGVIVLIVFGAGSYPAFAFSSYMPVEVLKGRFQSSSKGQRVRKILVVAQFGISIALIIGAGTVYQQLRFMKTQALGFNKEQMLVVEIGGAREAAQKAETMKSELRRLPGVMNVAASHTVPSRGLLARTSLPEGARENETRVIETLMVDHDFLSVYNIQLAAGRGFAKEMATDQTAAFVINETAAREFGWTVESAVGKKFRWGADKNGEIIGVARDFHFRSLQERIAPLVMHLNPGSHNYLTLRLHNGPYEETINAVENYWRALFPNRPFHFFFLDQAYDQQYRAEQKSSEIVGLFSLLAILLACLGLFGLASFTVEQRQKEIGVRKVLGATIANVIALLSKDFIRLVLYANLVAWPAAYFVTNQWLQNFAYRIEISWLAFALAGGTALLIALMTVSSQALKAALANPVEALRYE